MLELAKQRLAHFDAEKVTLIQGDFLRTGIPGSYEVILALGYFDYIEDAPAHIRRMRELLKLLQMLDTWYLRMRRLSPSSQRMVLKMKDKLRSLS